MRTGITIDVAAADRARLEAIVADRGSPQNHVWRCRIVLLTAAGLGRLKRGVFRSIVDLQAAINRFLAETNEAPKPFRWTANPDKIVAAVKRGHQLLESVH